MITPETEGNLPETEGSFCTTASCDVFKVINGKWHHFASPDLVRRLDSVFDSLDGSTTFNVSYSSAVPNVYHQLSSNTYSFSEPFTERERVERDFGSCHVTSSIPQHNDKRSRKPTEYNNFLQQALKEMAENNDTDASTRMSRAALLWKDKK